MKRRIHRSDEEWMQLITSCRQSGLSDKEWCVFNGIVVSSFYNAVVRLRKKPARSRNMNRMRKESMILQYLRFRMLFRLLSFRKTKRPMPLLPCRMRLRIMTIHIWFRSRLESFLCSCVMEQIRLLLDRSYPF